MILLIDNYDSFSYNLVQLIGEINPDIKVIRNDEKTVEEIRAMKPRSIRYRFLVCVWDIRQSVKCLEPRSVMPNN